MLSLPAPVLRIMVGLLTLVGAYGTACFAAAPAVESSPGTSSQAGSTGHPLAYYHFLLGSQQYLANNVDAAL